MGTITAQHVPTEWSNPTPSAHGSSATIGTVLLDPKDEDAGSVSPGVEKSLQTVQRERY